MRRVRSSSWKLCAEELTDRVKQNHPDQQWLFGKTRPKYLEQVPEARDFRALPLIRVNHGHSGASFFREFPFEGKGTRTTNPEFKRTPMICQPPILPAKLVSKLLWFLFGHPIFTGARSAKKERTKPHPKWALTSRASLFDPGYLSFRLPSGNRAHGVGPWLGS